ncbi:aminoacetone oxidase family FAD-binding enzyme, partial [bacterium]|nr:aminoacetone oxidase family FAD-binding enzyme [bacterium]
LAKGLGHSITSRIFPALTPLLLPTGHFPLPTTRHYHIHYAHLVGRRRQKGIEFTGPTLCTHFGLSGPCVLDISRYYIDATWEDAAHAHLTVNWLPSTTSEQFERDLLTLGHISVGRF